LPPAAGRLRRAQLDPPTLNPPPQGLTSIGALAQLKQLRHLSLPFNQLASLSSLAPLAGLCSLNASHNRLTSLEGLQQLGRLTKLDASHNLLPDTRPLPACPALEDVRLHANSIAQAAGVAALAQLPQLRVLCLAGNPVCALLDAGQYEAATFGLLGRLQVGRAAAAAEHCCCCCCCCCCSGGAPRLQSLRLGPAGTSDQPSPLPLAPATRSYWTASPAAKCPRRPALQLPGRRRRRRRRRCRCRCRHPPRHQQQHLCQHLLASWAAQAPQPGPPQAATAGPQVAATPSMPTGLPMHSPGPCWPAAAPQHLSNWPHALRSGSDTH
jgi:Leucine-rich repeat (LRR) protein